MSDPREPVCMVGMGLPGFLEGRRHAGPGLRSAQFALALAGAGHPVWLLCVMDRGRPLPPGVRLRPAPEAAPVVCRFVHEADCSGESLRAEAASMRPRAVVGVTAYGASVALRLGLEVPMWADVFGDLMAEAQAKAARTRQDACLVHFWSLLAPVLARADRFSAVSEAQAHALIGQLGMCGRLSAATAGEALVHVVPCSAEPEPAAVRQAGVAGRAEPVLRGRVVPEGARVLLWSGGFNTWCDVDTAVEGFARAAAADPLLHWVVTGGSIPGHDEASYRRFLEHAGLGRCKDRVHVLGWVDSSKLARIYREADLGLILERDLYERRFGSENRAVQWMAAGLPFVTTALSELGREACRCGAAFAVEVASADALARVLARRLADPTALAEAGAAGRRFAGQRLGIARTTAPLRSWVADPVRAGDHGRDRVLRPGLLSQPEALADVLEAYLAGLGLGELGRRSTRWLWRRMRASMSGTPRART